MPWLEQDSSWMAFSWGPLSVVMCILSGIPILHDRHLGPPGVSDQKEGYVYRDSLVGTGFALQDLFLASSMA